MSIKQQATDQAVQHTTAFAGSKLATGMTYGGGATAFVGGLTLNEFAIVFGMVIGLLGFCLQIYQTIHKHPLSAAAWRVEQKGRLLGRLSRPLIDLLFFWQGPGHCRNAYIKEFERKNYPDEYRTGAP